MQLKMFDDDDDDDEPSEPKFEGSTYDARYDGKRLRTNLDRVYQILKDGSPRTLEDIASLAGCSEAGASARIRDFRKDKWRKFYKVQAVNSERIRGGLWVYWFSK